MHAEIMTTSLWPQAVCLVDSYTLLCVCVCVVLEFMCMNMCVHIQYTYTHTPHRILSL